MDREEAKKIALDAINKEIEKHGEDYVYLMSPQRGKNTWTLKEAKESIINDTTLENSKYNIIDGIINFHEYKKKLEQNDKKNV